MRDKVYKIAHGIAFIGTLIVGAAFIALVLAAIVIGFKGMIEQIPLRSAETLPPAEPAEGVAWIMPESGEAAVWLSPVCADQAETAVWLDTYTEGDGPAPEWYRPDEPMSAEWVDGNARQSDIVNCTVDYNAPEGIDPGGIDWNICSSLVGWEGHMAEVWELDLYSRIVYLEFWGTSRECCEAGADSILQLWDSGYFGNTLGDVLTARAENGALVYTTYGYVWDVDYNPDGLAEMRELCEERFYNGPEWSAEFFQLYGWPEWAEPMYELDGVYFSTGKGWQR